MVAIFSCFYSCRMWYFYWEEVLFCQSPKSESGKGGMWKTQGQGKTCHETPRQTRFLDPSTDDTFSPSICPYPLILLRGNGRRPARSHFARPPKLVLEGALYSTFSPPPQNRTLRFAPICCFPTNESFSFMLSVQQHPKWYQNGWFSKWHVFKISKLQWRWQ